MANELLKEKRMVEVTTKVNWAHFIKKISDDMFQTYRVALIMDNFKTHTPVVLYEAF